MSKKKSNIIVNTLVLFAITLVAVLGLAVVNQITKEPIQKAEDAAKAASFKSVCVEAAEFKTAENSEEVLEKSVAQLADAGYGNCTINDYMETYDENGTLTGYAVAATTSIGYGGDYKIAIGFSLDGKITGFDVISHSETEGFGSKSTLPEFKDQFAGKSATDTISRGDGANDNEFDAISGATVTSTAVETVINSAITFYNANLKGE